MRTTRTKQNAPQSLLGKRGALLPLPRWRRRPIRIWSSKLLLSNVAFAWRAPCKNSRTIFRVCNGIKKGRASRGETSAQATVGLGEQAGAGAETSVNSAMAQRTIEIRATNAFGLHPGTPIARMFRLYAERIVSISALRQGRAQNNQTKPRSSELGDLEFRHARFLPACRTAPRRRQLCVEGLRDLARIGVAKWRLK